MAHVWQVASRSKRFLSSCSKPIIEFVPLIRILPQQHDPITFLKNNLNVLKSESHKSKMVGFICQDHDYSVTSKLNDALESFCVKSAGSMFGIATLSSEAIDDVQNQVSKYSESQFMRAFAVDCSDIARKKENYKRFYFMFELCSSLGKPVFLTTNEENSFVEMMISAQTVCQMINDGIFDFYPNLKVVVKSSIVPLILSQLKSNNPSNSLQKNETKHYFRQNICMLADFSDEGYLNYLISLAGDNQILLDSNGDHDTSNFSQLTVSKIGSLNAARLLKLNDEPLWNVNIDNITVLDKLNCVKLLSSKLRDKQTESKEFMIHADRLMTVLAEEALAMVPGIANKDIETPTGIFQGLEMSENPNLCVVSIVRSGDILLEAVRKLHPGIKVGKILIQRDETSKDKHAVLYYKKLPKDISDCFVLLVDPMLATGGSLICATDVLVDNGVKPSNILFVNLFSVEEGLENVQEKFPDMRVLTLSIDDYMNDDKYIVPGVGDFGDRYYGTQD